MITLILYIDLASSKIIHENDLFVFLLTWSCGHPKSDKLMHINSFSPYTLYKKIHTVNKTIMQQVCLISCGLQKFSYMTTTGKLTTSSLNCKLFALICFDATDCKFCCHPLTYFWHCILNSFG